MNYEDFLKIWHFGGKRGGIWEINIAVPINPVGNVISKAMSQHTFPVIFAYMVLLCVSTEPSDHYRRMELRAHHHENSHPALSQMNWGIYELMAI